MRTPFRHGLVAFSSCLLVPGVAAADSRWPAIVPTELAATRPAFESDADAEGMLWTVLITDRAEHGELSSTREYYFRVKVYTAAGAQRWSKRDLERPASGVSLGELEARTISPDGSVHAMERKAISEETTFKSGSRLATPQSDCPCRSTGRSSVCAARRCSRPRTCRPTGRRCTPGPGSPRMRTSRRSSRS